jgi:hypothetical protein
MLRQREVRIVGGARLLVLGAFLPNLLLEVEVLGAAVERGLELVLVGRTPTRRAPGSDLGAARRQLRDDQRTTGRTRPRRRAGAPSRCDSPIRLDNSGHSGASGRTGPWQPGSTRSRSSGCRLRPRPRRSAMPPTADTRTSARIRYLRPILRELTIVAPSGPKTKLPVCGIRRHRT